MKINGQPYRTIWLKAGDPGVVCIIDQRRLPHEIIVEELHSPEDCARAIRDMYVRGAPLIGATAAWGIYLAVLTKGIATLDEAAAMLRASRPTAVDLFHAIDYSLAYMARHPASEALAVARQAAESLAEASVEQCRRIGEHGLEIIKTIYQNKKEQPVNILTHCNAGWLGCVDYGTAISPIFLANREGIPVHVWVDETRPRNQGANLTAFELVHENVPHTLIADNTGGHLMQHGKVDMAIVGTDRTTRTGDVANKIGTYLKALAAKDNDVPFYVAAPSSSIDWRLSDGLREIPIEQRSADEVKYISGWDGHNWATVLIAPQETPAANYGFDVTPARLVTGIITERGVCEASEEGIIALFPEHKR